MTLVIICCFILFINRVSIHSFSYIDNIINCLNKIRLGASVKLARGFHLLAGVKGGYLTGGLDYSWNDLTFTASTYGEELGTRPGDREDRRYAVDASLRF